MMVKDALRKLPPSAMLQLERHPLLRELRRNASCSSLVELYATKHGVRALYAKLSEAETTALTAIVLRFANMPFDEASLVKRAGDEAPGPMLRIGLAGLCAAGIVVTVRKAWGERLHALPYDALGLWQLALFGEPDAELSEDEVELAVSSNGCLDDDLFALLAYAAKQELTLTQKGTIHKRHVQALQCKLQLADSEPLRRMGLSFDHSDIYDAGTAAVLDAALRLELLAADGGALRLAPARLRAWLRLPRERRSAALRAAWLARLWPAAEPGQHAAAAALHAPRGVWLALPQLAAWLARSASPGPAAETLAQLAAAQWLEPLAALGWLELGRHRPTGRLAFRVPADGVAAAAAQQGRFYVQPDFELVVPPDVPAAVRWELERFAEHVSMDQVHIYRLTRESVQFGCEQEATASEIELFLETHGMYGLPDNVRQGIRQWAGAYGRVTFARVGLLRCESSELADQVAALPKLAPHLLERLGSADFIVPAHKIAELQAALDKAGYAPRKAVTVPGESGAAGGGAARDGEFPRVLEPNAEAELLAEDRAIDDTAPEMTFDLLALDAAAAGKGLLHATDPLLYFELEPELPERSAALPDLRSIPSAWWKDYRAYHISTRKELIRKAIEWQSFLKLRTDGQDRTVVPQRLLEEREGWSVVGLERGREIRLSGDAWDEMKLVVPGLNDRGVKLE